MVIKAHNISKYKQKYLLDVTDHCKRFSTAVNLKSQFWGIKKSNHVPKRLLVEKEDTFGKQPTDIGGTKVNYLDNGGEKRVE